MAACNGSQSPTINNKKKKMKNLESMESSKKQTQYNDDATTIVHRRVKKEAEVEAEAEGPTIYHKNGNYNFNKKNGADNNCNLNHHDEQVVVLPAKVKKEDDNNNKNDDDHDQENNEENVWTNRWLPPTTANNTLHSVKSEEANDNNNKGSIIRSSSSSSNINNVNNNNNNNNDDEKMMNENNENNGNNYDDQDDNENENNQQDEHDYISLYHMAAEGDDDNDNGDVDSDNDNGNMNDDDDDNMNDHDDDNESKPPAKKMSNSNKWINAAGKKWNSNYEEILKYYDKDTNFIQYPKTAIRVAQEEQKRKTERLRQWLRYQRQSVTLSKEQKHKLEHIKYKTVIFSTRSLLLSSTTTANNDDNDAASATSAEIVPSIITHPSQQKESDGVDATDDDDDDDSNNRKKKQNSPADDNESKPPAKKKTRRHQSNDPFTNPVGGIDDNDDSKNPIIDPRESDVVCGRGGAALKHPGNLTYRGLVDLNKGPYISCPRREKIEISRSIVAAIREQRGRFLEQDATTGVWIDIGDKKATEKTSQALREKGNQNQNQDNPRPKTPTEQYLLNGSDKEQIQIQHKQEQLMSILDSPNNNGNCGNNNDRNDNIIDNNTNKHEYYERQQQPQQQYNYSLIQQQQQKKATATAAINALATSVIAANDRNDNTIDSNTNEHEYFKRQQQPQQQYNDFLIQQQQQEKATAAINENQNQNQVQNQTQMQTQLDSDDDDNDDNNAVSSTKSIEGKGTLGRYTSPHDRIWDEHFQCLVAYKKEYNSTTVPKAYKVNDLNLGIWVQRQRKNFRNDELSEERINHLESIGFVWNSYDAQWMETYQRLVAYKKQHKSTDVPFVYKVNGLFLGRWVNRQRTYFKNNELSEERINHLESIDFVWDSYDAQWMEMYNKLVEYKRQHHGSTPVRRGYTEDPSLGKWIYDQSYAYNKGNLLGKRLKLLNAINFDWS